MKYKFLAFFGFLSAVLLGWFIYKYVAGYAGDIDVSEVEKSVSIHHFDDAFFTANADNMKQTIANLQPEFTPFFQSNTDPLFWQKQRLDKGQNQLYTDWKNQHKNYTRFDEELQLLFKHIYFYYPDFPEIYAYTYISNLDFDYPLILADNYLFIGVDMYLGANHPAYQRDPSYLNYFKQSAFVQRDISETIALGFAQKNPEENTLLNEMIYWGKVLYFAQAMQPNIADSVLFKMSATKRDFCQANEVEMWNYFIQNDLLFNTADDAKRRFTLPAPFSKFGMPFDPNTPGMVGRWVGFRIVESYMNNNPSVSLPQLMADAHTRNIFKHSKYKP